MGADPETMPAGVKIVSLTVPHSLCGVLYYIYDAPPDWSMQGHPRWWNDTGNEPLLILGSPVELHSDLKLFAQTTGKETGNPWKPGHYRVELLDGNLEEPAGWNFEVR